jgi:peptide/nickel transport system substrate-binding protein
MKDTYKTLDLYHCRWFKPTGERVTANLYRWCNEEFSAILDEMSTYTVDAPELLDLHRQAMAIWLPELPDVPLGQAIIVLPMNTTYWTGWPNPQNPYVHEGFWHRTAMLMWNRLEPTQ